MMGPLSTILDFKNGKKRPLDEGTIPVYGGNGILGYTNDSNYQDCIAIGRVGAYCGSVYYEKNPCWISDNAIAALAKKDTDIVYAYYLLKSLNLNDRRIGTGQPLLTQGILNKITANILSYDQQVKVGLFLGRFDEAIQLNESINENLLQQAQTLYRELFVNTPNSDRITCRADEYFDIGIGKTPPRKEHQWFTTNPSDVTWVSISDMGNCGTFISQSSEQLTREAVERFKIRIVPDNTVLLSFKLTVGRIAITHGEMTTNEAIAHFKTDKPFINGYLYCYLKDFNYQTMGSTSSIATAVNSKIIKAMPFVVPTEDEIVRFNTATGPIFEMILKNQLENNLLVATRDALLPKLMSGELDIPVFDS